MTCPCRCCTMEHVDKNNETCLRCAKRVKYVAGLGSMSHSVPVEMTDMGRGRGFTSDDDRRILGPRKQSDSELARELGRTQESIWNRRLKLRREKAKGHVSEISGTRPPLAPPDKSSPAELTPFIDLMSVNLGNFGELYERLERSAQKNFRTPELQALWFIHQGLLAEGADSDQRRATDGA